MQKDKKPKVVQPIGYVKLKVSWIQTKNILTEA